MANIFDWVAEMTSDSSIGDTNSDKDNAGDDHWDHSHDRDDNISWGVDSTTIDNNGGD
jgi:hypothetical protein